MAADSVVDSEGEGGAGNFEEQATVSTGAMNEQLPEQEPKLEYDPHQETLTLDPPEKSPQSGPHETHLAERNPNILDEDDSDGFPAVSPRVSDTQMSVSAATNSLSIFRRGGTKRKKQAQKRMAALEKKFQKKLEILAGNFKPVPFVPVKALDFSSHEKVLQRLGLWKFVHIEFDRSIRSDLLLQLVATFNHSQRCSYINGVRIMVNRADLARALKLPVKKNTVSEGAEDARASDAEIAVIEEFLSNWVLLHEDTWMMPNEVLNWTRVIKEGHLERVDWAGLIWFMVEKELMQAPGLGNCYYASHLQCLIRSQRAELLSQQEVKEEDAEVKEIEVVEDLEANDTQVEDVKVKMQVEGVEVKEIEVVEDLEAKDTQEEDVEVKMQVEGVEVKEMPVDEAEVKEMPLDEAEVKEMSGDKAEAKEMLLDEAEVREMPVDGADVKEMPVDGAEVEEMPVQGAEVEEMPVQGLEVKEMPIEEAEGKEMPLDEVELKEMPVKEAEGKEMPLDEVELKEKQEEQFEEKEKQIEKIEMKDEQVDGEQDGNADVTMSGVNDHRRELEEQKIELSLGQETVERVDVQKETIGEQDVIGFEENRVRESRQSGQWFLEGKNALDETCLGLEHEDESIQDIEEEEGEEEDEQDEGEEEEHEGGEDEGLGGEEDEQQMSGFRLSPKCDTIDGLSSGNFAQPMDSEQVPFNSGMELRDHSPGEFLSSRDASRMISGGPFLFDNGKKRIIDHDTENSHQSLNTANKRLRTDASTEFDMCMEQIQHWMGKARMMYAEKEQGYQQSSVNQQYLLHELQQRETIIEHLQKAKYEEQQKRQAEVYRLQRELFLMGTLLESYKKALKESRREFDDYRARCPQSDEPLYKEVEGSGGLVLSVTELEKQRLRQEEEERASRLVLENKFKDIEKCLSAKLEAHLQQVSLLDTKLVHAENEVKLLRESFLKRRASGELELDCPSNE